MKEQIDEDEKHVREVFLQLCDKFLAKEIYATRRMAATAKAASSSSSGKN